MGTAIKHASLAVICNFRHLGTRVPGSDVENYKW